MNRYVFRKYDKNYVEVFQREKKIIGRLLAKQVLVEHVGSTSIEGLGGKKTIDILLGAVDKIPKIKKKLMDRYEFVVSSGTKKRLFFKGKIKYRRVPYIVHIHLTKYRGSDWEEMINFRDYLRLNPKRRVEYEKVKIKAAKLAEGNGKKYQHYKEKWISHIIKGFNGKGVAND